MAKEFVVTQMRGLCRCSKTQRATVAALGLRGRHKSVVMQDNPANRGQIMKIQHLVTVEVRSK
jgi:large subunit ribosomal protein L30